MAVEIFSRFENKFLIDQHTYLRIQDKLLEFMELDEHNSTNSFYTISNLYYDTEDNALIRTSLLKPAYKEKLRMRAYGVPVIDSKVYLEIKKKVRGRVNKRRTTLRLHEAYAFVATGEKPELKGYMNRQVMNEVEYLLRLHGVEPKLYLAYDRKAFFRRGDRDLRITFDTNIRTRRYDLRLEMGDYGEPLLEQGQWVMEVKTTGNLPFGLAGLLSEHRIFGKSLSKYGHEYQKLLANRREAKGEAVYA